MVPRRLESLRRKPAALVPAVVGSVIVLVTVSHFLSAAEPLAASLIGVGVLVFLCGPLLVGSGWLLWRPFDRIEVRRIVAWALAGAVPITTLASVVVFYQQTHGVIVAHPFIITSWVAGVGSIGGFLTGLYDVRRVRRQERFETTSRRLRALIEASPVAIVAIDSDGLVTDWSQAATELFGWEREEVIGEPYPLVPDHKQAEFQDHLRRVNDGNTLSGVESERRCKDGSLVAVSVWSSPIEHDGAVDEHMVALVDITQRKANRQELKLLSRAIEQADDAVIITDDAGVIEYINDAFVDLFGYTRKEVVGRTPRLLKSGEHDDAFYADLWETITAGDVFQAEVTNRRNTGELLDVELTIAPVKDDGEVTHYVAIERDITERKREGQQLEVLNRFLRHNVRNAVTVIDGNVRQLEDELDSPDAEVSIEAITRRTSELQSATDKARTVQRALETDHTEPLNVRSLFERRAEEFADEHRGATLAVNVPGDLWVKANATLGVAIEEALDNAVEHADTPEPKIRVVATAAADERVDICVVDDGPGVPDQERRVLETGEESDLRHGSGLGLWVMKWVVTILGGDISIAERETGGTVVTFTLPRARPTDREQRPAPSD